MSLCSEQPAQERIGEAAAQAVCPSFVTREFRPAAIIRGLPIYVVLGVWWVPALELWVRGVPPGKQGWDDWLPAGLVFLAVIGVPALWLARWRLRADEHGLWRRRLFQWQLWPWDAFATGQIYRLAPYSYRWPEQPFWRRRLIFHFLEPAEREWVRQVIRHFWSPPSAAQSEIRPPAEIGIRGPGYKLQMTPEGIEVRRGLNLRWYAWSDVQTLMLRRAERDDAGFGKLEFVLPDQSLPINPASDRQGANWPDTALIARLALSRVAPERVKILCRYGEPASAEEAARRLADIDRRERELARLKVYPWIIAGVTMAILILAALLGVLLNNGWPALLRLAAVVQQAVQQPQVGWQVAVPLFSFLTMSHLLMLLIMMVLRPGLHFASEECKVLKAQLAAWQSAGPNHLSPGRTVIHSQACERVEIGFEEQRQ
jgi:hypothetical protein